MKLVCPRRRGEWHVIRGRGWPDRHSFTLCSRFIDPDWLRKSGGPWDVTCRHCLKVLDAKVTT